MKCAKMLMCLLTLVSFSGCVLISAKDSSRADPHRLLQNNQLDKPDCILVDVTRTKMIGKPEVQMQVSVRNKCKTRKTFRIRPIYRKKKGEIQKENWEKHTVEIGRQVSQTWKLRGEKFSDIQVQFESLGESNHE